MEQKTGLDKAAYTMLTISGIIALLCMVTLIGLSVFGFVVGIGDSNGGGWILFLIMVGGIVLVPAMISWVAQLILYFQGMRRYRKGNLRSARALGIGNCVATILGNLYLLGMLSIGGDWSLELIAVFLVLGTGIIYMSVVLTLLIVSRKKVKATENQDYYGTENNFENSLNLK